MSLHYKCTKTDELLQKYPIISDQVDAGELRTLLLLLEEQLQKGVVGSVVELGCYVGTTSLFIRRLLDAYNADVEFHVYDSFAGLPPKVAQDESPLGVQFVEGELCATKRQFYDNFKKAGLLVPTVHKAWFRDLTVDDIPERVMFAFLDGDYYRSIRDSLRVIKPRLTKDAIIVVDDYANEALPGTACAVDEWLAANSQSLHIQKSLAVIR